MALITFNGRPYELVTFDDLTMDEALVLWEYAKLSVDQVPDLEGMHPGVVMALIHIAVARAEPDETGKTIRGMVGRMKMTELQDVFHDISVEVPELPPPNEPGPPFNEPGPPSPNTGSGGTSETIGAQPPAPTPPNGSGSPGSATGQASDRVTSVG